MSGVSDRSARPLTPDLCWCRLTRDLVEQKLKGDVAQMIRKNQMLERDLDSLDVKIGLLVKNRITLQVSQRTAPFSIVPY